MPEDIQAQVERYRQTYRGALMSIKRSTPVDNAEYWAWEKRRRKMADEAWAAAEELERLIRIKTDARELERMAEALRAKTQGRRTVCGAPDPA